MNPAAHPNLLVIMTDQQSATMLSCAGNPDVQTPHIDVLAARGVRFERACCTQPICVPSRTSLWTGRMPHETGVTYNLDRHDVIVPCVGRHLADAGYDSHYVGKWHVPMHTSNHAWHGFATMSHTHGHHTDPHVAPACDALFARRRDKPFFIVASFHNPHDICQWARGDLLPNGPLPPPVQPSSNKILPNLPANHQPSDGEPDVIRELQRSHWRTYPTTDFTDLDWRRYRWAYARLVEKVDLQVGEVLASLDAHGLRDHTTIVFLSDHGDGNAAHRWSQKSLFYDEIARTPFIVVPPGGIEPRVDQGNLISTGLDLVPTLCAYAEVTPPVGERGENLRPVIEQHATLVRDFVVSETTLAPEYGIDSGVYGRMLRTARFKYVAFSQGRKREQLFDLDRDPGETRDLCEQPAHAKTLEIHRHNLADWCRQTADPFVVPQVNHDGWMDVDTPVILQTDTRSRLESLTRMPDVSVTLRVVAPLFKALSVSRNVLNVRAVSTEGSRQALFNTAFVTAAVPPKKPILKSSLVTEFHNRCNSVDSFSLYIRNRQEVAGIFITLVKGY